MTVLGNTIERVATNELDFYCALQDYSPEPPVPPENIPCENRHLHRRHSHLNKQATTPSPSSIFRRQATS